MKCFKILQRIKAIRLFLLASFFWSCDQVEGRLEVFAIALNTNLEFSQEGSLKYPQVKVSGIVHFDLLDNQLIDAPFWGNDEDEQWWIDKENWI